MQYQVQDPSGQTHVIEGPEGATPEQVMTQAQALIPSPKADHTPDLEAAALGVGSAIPAEAKLGGALGAGVQKLAGNESPFSDLYEHNKGAIRSANDEAWNRSPVSYGTGKVAGILGTSMIPGVGEALATVPGSAAFGAAQAFGESEGTPTQELADTAKGAALGAGTGAIASKLSELAGAAPEAGEHMANELELKNSGIPKSVILKATRSGENPADTRNTIGSFLRENTEKGATRGQDYEDFLKLRNTVAGPAVEKALGDIQEAGKGIDPNWDATKFDSEDLRMSLIDEAHKLQNSGFKDAQGMAKPWQEIHGWIADKAGDTGLLSLDDLKQAMEHTGDMLGNVSPTSDKFRTYSHMYGVLADARDKAVEQIAAQTEHPELAQNLLAANKQYSTIARLLPALKSAAAAGESGTGGAFTSRIGVMGGMMALAMGDIPRAAAFLVGGRAIMPMMAAMGKKFAQNAPELGAAAGKYGPILAKAANAGSQQLALTHDMLLKHDPEYRQIVQQASR